MADEIALTWQSENIPNEDFLYMRVHKQNFCAKYPTFSPGVFVNRGGGMSTDWSKYSTPSETRNRGKVPKDNAIIRMLASDVGNIEGQTVIHTPDIPNRNRSHTDVIGEKDVEVRLKFSRISKDIILRVEDPVE
jgi:hypothetical protein